ncbi:uncharacterized protein METZ01_LOCUS418020, partial [marine metagenome]
MKNKLSFILGGSGLIGRSVSLEFVRAGSDICIIDNNKKSSMKLLEELKEINPNSSFAYLDCSNMDS